MPLTEAQKVERRALIERNRKQRAEAERRRRQEQDRKFQEQRSRFHRMVEAWRDDPEETEGKDILRICSHILHHRVLWDANNAVLFGQNADGNFEVKGGRIDALRPSMQMLLAFVKAQHKLEHDRRLLELRETAQNARLGVTQAPDREEKTPDSAKQPHAPE